MTIPTIDPGQSAEAQAIKQLHQELFRTVPYEYIDQVYSLLSNLTGIAYADIPRIFTGDHVHIRAQLAPVVNNNFYFVFVKPIYLDWTYIKCTTLNLITQAQVTYTDGTNEFLVHGVLADGNYDTFAPPTKNLPIHKIEFWNMDPLLHANIFRILMQMADVSASVNVTSGMEPSTNVYYTDEATNPIPAGLVGVAIVFGFDSQCIIIKNRTGLPGCAAAQVLEISQDGGLTWEKIDSNWAITFDYKELSGILVRDPLGVGGQEYSIWGW